MGSNLINLADSYKYSHYNQYPAGLQNLHCYFEARKKHYPSGVMFFGLQYYLKKYFMRVPTQQEVDDASKMAQLHGIPFDYSGWEHISSLGYYPLRIVSAPEGSVKGARETLMTVENTDQRVPWLASFVETLLVKLWYPCTVASKAHFVRKVLESNLTEPDDAWVDFAYHNFGDRGSTSVAAAALGGAAHLISFCGTDNFNALSLIQQFYGGVDGATGFSIPASEHSTVTSWERTGENEMIVNYLTRYGDSPMIACVLDSYNIFSAVDFVTNPNERPRQMIEAGNKIFVMRPDSGDPVDVIRKIFAICEKNGVPFTQDKDGKKLFKNYRIIWGDGISPVTINQILGEVLLLGYSYKNMAFGSGGDLMQKIDRDTLGFAYKCSAARRDGVWYDVNKEPLGSPEKASRKGQQFIPDGQLRFQDGKLHNEVTFRDVRANAGRG